MVLHRTPLAALVALAILGLSPAAAQDSPERTALLTRIYTKAPGKDKSYACFVRTYDAAHLASHPKQKVREMKLLVTAERDPEDKKLRNSFRMGLKYRNNRGGMFDSSGDCGMNDTDDRGNKTTNVTFGCSVDCDGGGFSVRLSNNDKSVLLELSRVRIWHDNKPDEEAEYELVAGADDKIFRLDRVGLAQCMPLVHDRKELAAIRTLPPKR